MLKQIGSTLRILIRVIFLYMEDLLKFSHSLELSRDTRKIILDMIHSMQSLFPVSRLLTIKDNNADYAVIMDQAPEILRIAREKQEIFEGILNPEDLEKYLNAPSDFKEILGEVEKLQSALSDYQEIACWLTYRFASMIREHIEMTCPEEIEPLNKKLSGLSKSTRDIYPKVRSKLRVV
jgi:hypothetical protein